MAFSSLGDKDSLFELMEAIARYPLVETPWGPGYMLPVLRETRPLHGDPERVTFVSAEAIRKLRASAQAGVAGVIRSNGGLVVQFKTDADSEPERKRGNVQTVFIPDDLTLPPESEGKE